jgi:hypothetical protein
MILSKIASAIRDQNWFTVILEILIVVIGIFLGLQVTEWNQDRIDRQDEARVLNQLRDEVASAEAFARRITDLRISVLDDAVAAMDVLFDRADGRGLSKEECQALRATGLISLRFVELLSFDELVSSGRLNIIQDNELRSALIGLRQNIGAADRSMAQFAALQPDLVGEFPEAFKLTSTINEAVTSRREVGVDGICDTVWMKNSQAFLNAAARSVDAYDAFVRDVVLPWRDGVARVQKRLDVVLGVEKERATP